MTPDEREQHKREIKRQAAALEEKETAKRNKADAARVADALARSDHGFEMAMWVVVVVVCYLFGFIAVLAYFK